MHVNFLSGSEKITISGDLEHGFFVNYGMQKYNGDWVPTSTAGRFRDFFTAYRTMKQHRPTAHAYAAASWDGLNMN